jgi:hypothetical protein
MRSRRCFCRVIAFDAAAYFASCVAVARPPLESTAVEDQPEVLVAASDSRITVGGIAPLSVSIGAMHVRGETWPRNHICVGNIFISCVEKEMVIVFFMILRMARIMHSPVARQI